MSAVRPGLVQGNGPDPALLCRDPAVVRAYAGDPLVHDDRISLRLFAACRQAGRSALTHAGDLAVPLLLMHDGADRITSLSASREFAGRVRGAELAALGRLLPRTAQ